MTIEPETAASQPNPPEIDPSPRFINSLGMTMVRIEPGEFLMGSTEDQIARLLKLFPDARKEWLDPELPRHPVKMTRPFYLAAHPVTVGQFRRFVEASGYKTEAEATGAGSYARDGTGWKLDPATNWRNPGFAQEDDHPVVCVSHNDAVAFLGWLGQHEADRDRGYRLPTEAEWEYACRAGTAGLYGESDDPESLVRIANIADASFKKVDPDAVCIRGDDGYVHTSPVGSFAPNAWHLYDMIGNIWEWCDDTFDPTFYRSSPVEDPRSTAGASARVFRGGGWYGHPRASRPADRFGNAATDRYIALGFRAAADRG